MFGAISDDARGLQPIVSLLRATLESTADGILVVDRDGRIVTSNRQFAVMWRIPAEVVTSRKLQTLPTARPSTHCGRE